MVFIFLLLWSLLLHCEARFRVGRNRRDTCFVIQTCGRSLSRVTVGNVTTVDGGLPGWLQLLLLLLDWLQRVTFVDSGYPVVAALVKHLSHLARSERRREVTPGTGGAR